MIDWLWFMVDWLWLMIDWFWLMVHWLWFMVSVVMSISMVMSMVEVTINIIVWSDIRILILIEDFTAMNSRLSVSISSKETIVI